MKGTRSHTVLYIEDNEATRQLLEFILDREDNLSLIMAVDGASGLEAAKTENPDIILLDLILPDMSGLAVLTALRQDPLTKNIPVVAVSGDCISQFSADDPISFDKFLTKPIEVGPLLETIHELLDS